MAFLRHSNSHLHFTMLPVALISIMPPQPATIWRVVLARPMSITLLTILPHLEAEITQPRLRRVYRHQPQQIRRLRLQPRHPLRRLFRMVDLRKGGHPGRSHLQAAMKWSITQTLIVVNIALTSVVIQGALIASGRPLPFQLPSLLLL